MSRNIHCTFVSEKLAKIRWRPNVFPYGKPNSFVTAGWDNSVNQIRLWEIKPQLTDEHNLESDINPYEIRVLPIDGDITELKFLDSDHFVASTSMGDVYLLKIEANEVEEINIAESIKWKGLHKTSTNYGNASCTSFAHYDKDIVTVGSDGRINLLSTTSMRPTSTIDEADSSPLKCVQFLKFNEIVTCNSAGLFKIWDLRASNNIPESTFMLRNDCIMMVNCLALHPAQNHIIASGDESGGLTFWDLRQNTYPLNSYTSDSECINDIMFHPDVPDQVFTCTDGGDLFHWTGLKKGAFCEHPFYLSAAGSSKYDITRLMPELHVPINCMDINGENLICGGDNEAMYLIEHLNLYGA